MKYVFQYNTLVNRDYNIYKEITLNPFVFSFVGIFDPNKVMNIVDYSKKRKANILENIIPGTTLTLESLIMIYKILLDYDFFKSEQFNIYSKYVDSLLSSPKVEEVTIMVNDITDEIQDHQIENIKNRFNSHINLKIKKTKSPFISEDLKEIEWDCVSLRDVEEVIELVNSDVSIKGKDIILDESTFNKIDPVNYIILQEKEARVDYRAMI